MNVRILEPMTVTKMPAVLTLLEVIHVLVCWATQEMGLIVKVSMWTSAQMAHPLQCVMSTISILFFIPFFNFVDFHSILPSFCDCHSINVHIM